MVCLIYIICNTFKIMANNIKIKKNTKKYKSKIIHPLKKNNYVNNEDDIVVDFILE